MKVEAPAFTRGLGPELTDFLKTTVPFTSQPEPANARVILIGKGDDLAGLQKGGKLRAAIESGATAIVFSPTEKFVDLFSSDIMDAKRTVGEFADLSPCAVTLLADGLAPMDLKWWSRKDDWRTFISYVSHRLQTNSTARELIRFIPVHGYISEEKVKEQYRTVLFEIPLGKGRLWGCDLDIEASLSVDPAAQKFAKNLLGAAADPNSTLNLPKVPTHQELLKGVSKSAR
jgi:hypothetical protein